MASLGDTLVGRYRLDAVVGAGGFATVYRARDLRLERDVAVKIMLPNMAADDVVVARFDREARALAAFSHPNVVAIHDVEPAEPSVGQAPFLVMDLCEGGSLADLFAESESQGLAPDVLIPLLVDVSAGLEALHELGMIHRDVKPSNVLLSGGRALVGDLGIVSEGSDADTASSQALGTLAYVAPEQLSGAPATAASDVHALGVVAFTGLTGRLPRAAGSVAELVAASAETTPQVSALSPDLGAVFDRPIADALSRDPASRPSIRQLGLRLERGLERWQETAAIRRTVASGGVAAAAAAGSDLIREPGHGSGPSPDDPTVLNVGLPTTKPMVSPEAPSRGAAGGLAPAAGRETRTDPGRHPARAWRAVAAGTVLVLGLGALAVLWTAIDPGDPDAGVIPAVGTPDAPTVATGQPASPPPSATHAPTVTPAPAAVGPDAAAREASREMHAAIEAARGRSGLNGREVKAIDGPLGRFDRAIEQGEAEDAREAAEAVEEAVRELNDAREVDPDAGARLLTAAEGLVAAADDLPDR